MHRKTRISKLIHDIKIVLFGNTNQMLCTLKERERQLNELRTLSRKDHLCPLYGVCTGVCPFHYDNKTKKFSVSHTETTKTILSRIELELDKKDSYFG